MAIGRSTEGWLPLPNCATDETRTTTALAGDDWVIHNHPMFMSPARFVATVVGVCLLLSACGGDEPDPTSCSLTTPCADGFVCQDNTCAARCTEASCSDGVCNPNTGRCVECRGDADCPDGQLCNSAGQRCLVPVVECSADEDCPGGRCDIDKAVCVQCFNDLDCGDQQRCDPVSRSCTGALGCTTDADCGDDVCEPQGLQCVECYLPVHCSSGQCDTITNSCVIACRDDDETEDNDDTAGNGTAVNLASGGSHQGAVCAGDVDAFEFDGAAGALRVELLVSDAAAFTMLVTTDTGASIGTVTTAATGLTMSVPGFAGGLHRVVVRGSNSGDAGDYLLRVTIDAPDPCVELDSEPNDNAAQAMAAVLGTPASGALCGNVDYWRFNATVGDVINARAVTTTEAGSVAVRIESSTGSLVAEGNPAEGTIATSGSYFVRLSATTPLSYSLTIDANEAPVCNQQDAEPNNTPATAVAIPNDTVRNGTICSGDIDHWVFAIANRDDIRVSLSGAAVRMRIVNDAGTQVGGSGTVIEVPDAAAGTYRIVVDDAATGDYAVALQVTAEPNNGCDEGGVEPDSVASPRPLAPTGAAVPGNICDADDEDFFAIDVAFATELVVRAQFVDADGDIDLKLLDSTGAELARSSGVTDSETIRLEVQPGRYYGLVFGFSDNTNTYAINASMVGCRPDDDFEDNDTLATATPARAGVINAVRCPADDDHYALALQTGDNIALSATGGVSVALLTINGDVLAQNAVGGEFALGNIPGGRYVVRVSGSSAARIDYALNLNITGVGGRCVDDGATPNQSPETAAIIDDDGLADGSYNLSTLMTCASAPDHFLVDLPGQKAVTFRLNHIAARDLDVEVLEQRGTTPFYRQLARAFGTTSLDDVAGVMNVGGRVLVKVTGFSIPVVGEPYTLGIEVATPPTSVCQNDRFDVFTASDDEVRRTYSNNATTDTDSDPNTFVRPVELARGEILPELRICSGDVDFFSLATTAGQAITVTVSYAHSGGRDIDLRVFGPDGSDADMLLDPVPCGGCAGIDGTEEVTFTPIAGTYFFEVFGFMNSENSYTLNVR
jgi:hypothetical protein